MQLTVEFEQEDDGRWLSEVPELPGVLAYGVSRQGAVQRVQALALRVLADRDSIGIERRVKMDNVDALADVISSRFSHVAIREDYGWPHNAALSVIDCVLSLNRRYDGFVLPRVEAFARQHPTVVELAHLSELLNGCANVGDFCLRELNYNHAAREQVLRGVLKYMILAQAEQEGVSEWMRLQAWAKSAKPSDFWFVGVAGFGLSGFQYLRMLFGAQTTKPDIHIMQFVSNVVGHKVTGAQALLLLEAASAKVGLPLREVDGAIWEAGARGV